MVASSPCRPPKSELLDVDLRNLIRKESAEDVAVCHQYSGLERLCGSGGVRGASLGMTGGLRLLHLFGDLIGNLLRDLEIGGCIQQRPGKGSWIYDKSVGRLEFVPIKRGFDGAIY